MFVNSNWPCWEVDAESGLADVGERTDKEKVNDTFALNSIGKILSGTGLCGCSELLY